MTDPMPESRRRESFDEMIRTPTSDTPVEPARPAAWAGWVLPAATIILAMLGVGALAAAALTPSHADASTTTATSTPTPSQASIRMQPPPTQSATGVATAAGRPVSELADRAWVSRIAKAGAIPERALAAYTGAALAVAETDPGCGIGWNTLAAIGFVESEHGTIHGSAIGSDGVASPTIIGIPLDGNGTNPVPDTDHGELDGDTIWDRAIGPMQFIPATWTQYAQDGDLDDVANVHDIDDAALTAAVYLCTAAKNLDRPEQWIAAINAYNPSVEYNNRVADAANRFAGLS
jgi:membrane-bound lytic murein transglycosylase B